MIIDARGKSCPTPVVMTKKYLDSIVEGTFTVLIDSEVSKINVTKFLESQGVFFEVEQSGIEYKINVVKGYNCELPQAEKGEVKGSVKNIVVFISSETIGYENIDLGKILMKGFLKNLKEQTPLPKTIIFVNTGVFITAKNSDIIDDLKELESLGVEILNCGTCLNFFNIDTKDLFVGSVTDAYTVAKRLFDADKVIRL
jgi:selenium metabolism protein YedF